MEIKCTDCGWEGDWDELKPVKVDGEHIPACPKCTGVKFMEQADLFDDEESKKDGKG